MPKLPLNKSQREAVTTLGRPILVLAGAGSGKTRVVAGRIAHLILEQGVSPGQILGVTFTNKAAREMSERVRQIVGARKAKGVTLSTFHSFGCKILRAEMHHLGRPNNFTIYAGGEQISLITGLLRDLYGERMALHPGYVLNRISCAKNRMQTPDTFTPEHHDKYDEVLPTVYARYQQSLRACNAVDFDDLLFLVLNLFQQHPKVAKKYQKKYKYIIVDEYQDTNNLQFEIIESLVGDGDGLCVVGDDDQSIYAWRGADIHNILNFEKRHRNCLRVTLDINYRSTETILSAANAVIANNPGRHDKTLRSDIGGGVCIDVLRCSHESDEAAGIVERLLHFRDRFSLDWRDFAVLYRANAQSKPFERLLIQRRLPYRVIGGTQLYDRKEVRDVLAYLRVIVNPKDNLNLLRVLNFPRRGIGETSIDKIMAWSVEREAPLEDSLRFAGGIPGLPGETLKGIESFLALVDGFRGELKKPSNRRQVATFVERIVTATGLQEALRAAREPRERVEARIRNIENVLASARAYEGEAGAKATIREFVEQMALVSATDRNESKENQVPDVITLMTLHAAKGLEFPFVFLAGVEDGLIPHQRSLRDAGGIHEERRLFYVGMTRARRHLTLSYADERVTENGAKSLPPSRFLGEIPDQYQNVTHTSQGVDHCHLDPETAAGRLDFGAFLTELQTKRSQQAKIAS